MDGPKNGIPSRSRCEPATTTVPPPPGRTASNNANSWTPGGIPRFRSFGKSTCHPLCGTAQALLLGTENSSDGFKRRLGFMGTQASPARVWIVSSSSAGINLGESPTPRPNVELTLRWSNWSSPVRSHSPSRCTQPCRPRARITTSRARTTSSAGRKRSKRSSPRARNTSC